MRNLNIMLLITSDFLDVAIFVLGFVILGLLVYLMYMLLFNKNETLLLEYNQGTINIRENEEPLLISNADYVDDEIVEDWTDESTYARYNYSFDARAHLADEKSKKRYNELKNYLLSYKGMKLKKSWRNESFRIGGKTLAKFWINGRVIDMYINLEPREISDLTYKYVGNKEMHKKTPVLFKITSDQNLADGYNLLELKLKKFEKNELAEEENYILEYIDRKTLLANGLIKIKIYKKKTKEEE